MSLSNRAIMDFLSLTRQMSQHKSSPQDNGSSDSKEVAAFQKKKEVSAIVKSIRTVDSEIRDLRQGESNESKLIDSYTLMSSLYATVILKYYDVIPVAYQSWDVHNSLWKGCFYNRIEQYRGEMRECNGTIKKLSKGQAVDGKVDKARRKLVRIVTSFSQFLAESSKFYQDLMLNLESTMNAKGIDAKSHSMLRHHTYKCLLFLGDIARYTEQNSDSKEKNFSVALRYYERAAFMEPESGNPHNQMAVLAGYSSAECVAVFHYCRSILAKKPFASGLENLMIFYNKVRKQHEAWLEGEGAPEVANSSTGFGERKSREASKANKVKVFLIRFTHLHGTLFEEANRALQRADGTVGTESSASVDLKDPESLESALDVSKTLDNVQEILLELEDLLAAAVFSDSLLLKMLVMCIFSVHMNVPPSPEDEKSGSQKGNSRSSKSGKRAAALMGRGPRFTGESVALVVIYEFVKKIANRTRVLALPSDSAKGGAGVKGPFGGGGSTKNSSYLNRLVPVLNVFCDWLECNSHYLKASHASLNGHGQSNKALYADQPLIDKEGKSRASMRSCLCQLAEVLGHSPPGEGSDTSNGGKLWRPPAVGTTNSSAESAKPLREHIELFGFLPLAALYDGYFTPFAPKTASASSSSSSNERPGSSSILPTPVQEDSARERRAKAFREFVKAWVIPCAQREVVEAEGRRLQQQEVAEAEMGAEADAQPSWRKKNSMKPPVTVSVPAPAPVAKGLVQGPTSGVLSPHFDIAEGTDSRMESSLTGVGAENAWKSESETAASFTYFSPGSDPHAPPAAQEERDLETEDMRQSKSDGADETESVLGEEVVFRPAFGLGIGLRLGTGYGASFSQGLPGQPRDGAVGDMMVVENDDHQVLQPPPGLNYGGDAASSQNLGFLASLADAPLSAAMYSEAADPEEFGFPTNFLGEAPWWNADTHGSSDVIDDDLQRNNLLFGGVDQSATGISLLQRISEASSKWMPGIANVGGAGEIDDVGDLVLPPPVPLKHKNSFGVGPPGAVDPMTLQTGGTFTANPFFSSNGN